MSGQERVSRIGSAVRRRVVVRLFRELVERSACIRLRSLEEVAPARAADRRDARGNDPARPEKRQDRIPNDEEHRNVRKDRVRHSGTVRRRGERVKVQVGERLRRRVQVAVRVRQQDDVGLLDRSRAIKALCVRYTRVRFLANKQTRKRSRD